MFLGRGSFSASTAPIIRAREKASPTYLPYLCSINTHLSAMLAGTRLEARLLDAMQSMLEGMTQGMVEQRSAAKAYEKAALPTFSCRDIIGLRMDPRTIQEYLFKSHTFPIQINLHTSQSPVETTQTDIASTNHMTNLGLFSPTAQGSPPSYLIR